MPNPTPAEDAAPELSTMNKLRNEVKKLTDERTVLMSELRSAKSVNAALASHIQRQDRIITLLDAEVVRTSAALAHLQTTVAEQQDMAAIKRREEG